LKLFTRDSNRISENVPRNTSFLQDAVSRCACRCSRSRAYLL